jgi:hypothetical protein
MGGLLYASEAWILSILGWTGLTVQEVWGFVLLNSYVYYGMLFLSTCNVIMVGCFPNMRALKAAYFSAVLVLLITSLECIFDTPALEFLRWDQDASSSRLKSPVHSSSHSCFCQVVCNGRHDRTFLARV